MDKECHQRDKDNSSVGWLILADPAEAGMRGERVNGARFPRLPPPLNIILGFKPFGMIHRHRFPSVHLYVSLLMWVYFILLSGI